MAFVKSYRRLSSMIQARSPAHHESSVLFSLPNELLLIIAENLEVKDVKSLLLVNRHLSYLLAPTFQRIALEGFKPMEWEDFTILHWAAYRHHEPLVRLLLDRGFNVDKQTISEGTTPLHYAAMSGDEPVVRLLLDRGANIEQQDHVSQATERSYWGRRNVVRIVKLHGMTPLHYAVMGGRRGVVRVLLDAGAKIDTQDMVNGKSALHMAAEMVDWKMVRLLLGRGADINARDHQQRTPIDYAPTIPHPKNTVHDPHSKQRDLPKLLLLDAMGRLKYEYLSREWI